jgi:hypothetical protein
MKLLPCLIVAVLAWLYLRKPATATTTTSTGLAGFFAVGTPEATAPNRPTRPAPVGSHWSYRYSGMIDDSGPGWYIDKDDGSLDPTSATGTGPPDLTFG